MPIDQPKLPKAGEIILVKVLEVRQKVKEAIKKGNFLYDRHDIYMETKTGEKYVGEYLTTQQYTDQFPVGVWQSVKCTTVTQYGFEVQPTEGLPEPNSTSRDTSAATYSPAPRTGSMSGTSIAFAYSFAKDVLVEQLKYSPYLQGLSIEELGNKVADIGDVINRRMISNAQ